MSSDHAPEALLAAWRGQPTSGFRLVPSDLAKQIRRDVRWARPAFGLSLVFFAVMIIWGGAELISVADPIQRIGYVLWVLAVGFFVGQMFVLRRRVQAVRFDVDRTTAPSLPSARSYLIARRAFHGGRWLWARIAVMFPVVPVLSYGQLGADSFTLGSYLAGVIAPWTALLAFAAFVVQRGAARRYDRLLRELDDIERHSPMNRFMAAHESWKER